MDTPAKTEVPVSAASAAKAGGPQDRFEKWAQKLLDFSARNRLLNIPRNSKQVLALLGADVAALQDQLADDETIVIRSLVEAVGEKDAEDWRAGRVPPEKRAEVLADELAHHRLCVDFAKKEARKRLSDLYHDARTDLEESGVNTLFLAVGVLEWVDPALGAAHKTYRAPILLIPVRLERPSMAEGVRMRRLDEETAFNPTLAEFLRSQFKLTVPGIDPLPTDESGVDVAKVLESVRQAVAKMDGWSVCDEAVLGCFSFGKFVMWKDMTERVGELKKNPLVSHLIGGGGSFDDGVEVFPPEEIAEHIRPSEIYCPVSADSSQLTAVLYSELGKTFVLHGPPGTGKSQTITNIIAHNLAKGRRVLFVSEKKAALDVVRDRLDRIGLTPFCLELHSNKTEKRKFYEQIKAALEVSETSVPGEWDRVVAEFSKCREELDAYIRALHQVYPNGLTPYDCFSRAIRYGGKSVPALIGVDCLTQEREAYLASRQSVVELLNDFRAVPEEALKAMPALKADVWSPVFERQLKGAAESLSSAAAALKPTLEPLLAAFGRGEDPSLASSASLAETLADAERRLAGYDRAKVAELDLESVARRVEENAKSFCLCRFFKNRSLVKELAGIVRSGGEPLTVERIAADLDVFRTCRTLVKSGLEGSVAGFLAQWKAFESERTKFLEVAGDELFRDDVREIPARCAAIVASLGELRGVLKYRKTLAGAVSLGMGAFEKYIVENDDGALDAAETFDDSYTAKMLDAILDRTPVLAAFTGTTQEERVAKFRDLDDRHTALARQVVFAKIAATLPRRRNGPCPDGTELGMVKRECEKKTRQKAVRQMLAESKTLIPTLKPCFLMSPLSVAQYLPVDAAFDLIVFDEASQIPVWDAIGVIARGAQLIVVGDPKQMPPTSFFQKGESEDGEEEESDVIEDQESILDECLVAGVYASYLNWHYRSRHESLIAFSNEHYYANKLCTFPAAANSPRLGVKFMFVEGGVCAKAGKGPKTNRVEATALVDYICTEIRKPGYKPRSIGVVTFSLPQQKLIRTLIDERREADPELERLLPEDGPNAYFVKNLENVQGDESDVILFSVGFAPDEDGKFAMNFGPLNRSGGERRLNVAVTRAKEQVVVFSSIHASQIDAGEDGRTKAVGAGHLKAFLEYAERGTAVRAAAGAESDGGDFVEAVGSFLRESGYEVVRNVGCSRYRVDLAVCDPETPGRYLLGVECDGPSYAAQRTAQDRDVNRTGVLRGLGWHMCRVWSMDWAYDRKRAEERLLGLLAEIRNGVADAAPPPKSAEPAPAGSETSADAEPSVPAAAHPVYRPWTCTKKHRAEKFYDEMSRLDISWEMKEIVAQEGPICESCLRRRVTAAWGITRVIEKVNRVLDACMPLDGVVTKHETGNVYWAPEHDPQAYRDYRVPSSDESSKRAVDEIPPEELANAMREALDELGACPQDSLYRDMVRVFGLSSLTAKVRRHLDVAYALVGTRAC